MPDTLGDKATSFLDDIAEKIGIETETLVVAIIAGVSILLIIAVALSGGSTSNGEESL